MANNGFAVYSLPDVINVISHPSVGKCVLSDAGGGRITISFSGDMSNITTTATGYVVINKLVSKNGSIGLEIPVNSEADMFLRKLIAYIEKAKTSEFALTRLSLVDPAGHRKLDFSGVVPQKKPDEGYDQTSGNRQYNLLYAEMVTSAA